MFISKNEKENLNLEVERARDGVKYLSEEIDRLNNEVDGLKSMFMTLVEINSEEIGSKIKDLTKTIYTGFKDLFVGEDEKVMPKKKAKAKSKAKVQSKQMPKPSINKTNCKKVVK